MNSVFAGKIEFSNWGRGGGHVKWWREEGRDVGSKAGLPLHVPALWTIAAPSSSVAVPNHTTLLVVIAVGFSISSSDSEFSYTLRRQEFQFLLVEQHAGERARA